MGQASLLRPLQQLGEGLQRFVRVPELRVACVEASAQMRGPALTVVQAMAHLADCRSPLLVVEFDQAGDSDVAWEAATDELRRVHGVLRAAGGPLAPLAERPLRAQGSASFAAQALQCIGTVRAPAEGLFVVIVSTSAAPDVMWLRRLAEIIRSPRLTAARFVVVVSTSDEVATWIGTLDAGSFLHIPCVVDERAALAEEEAEITAEEELGVGFRGAWPSGVMPPPRPWLAAPKPAGPAVSPPTTGERRPAAAPAAAAPANHAARLRIAIRRASLALRKGDGPEAVRQQAMARDICVEAGQIREAITMELVLGAYLAQLGQPPLAITTFGQAAERAQSIEAHDLAAQAHLAAASTHDRSGAAPAALASFRNGIMAARDADEVALVFQGYWEAGQVAVRLDLEVDCIALWGDAFAYAQTLDASRLRGTLAKEVISELARILARQRRYSEAREVERAAAALELPS